jgi:hypothetical protein
MNAQPWEYPFKIFVFADPFGPTIVNVNIYLRTINDINDYKMVGKHY